MTTITFPTDTLIISVPITREDDGLPLNLSAATVEAVAQRRGSTAIDATASVTDAAGGVVQVSWDPETFSPAVYDWQLRVTIAGEVQTVVSDTILAQRSIRAPA